MYHESGMFKAWQLGRLEKIRTLIKRLEDELNIVVRDENPDTFNLRQQVIKEEMLYEYRFLNDLFHIEEHEFETKKDAFKNHCKERDKEIKGTSLSFTALFEGIVNKTYLEIVELLFQPKSLEERLSIISPSTKKMIRVTHDDSSLKHNSQYHAKKRQECLKAIPLTVVAHPISEISETSAYSKDNLSEYVICDDLIIWLGDIAHLSFERQVEIYLALKEKHPHLHQAIYSHNHSLKQLETEIHYFQSNGRTARMAIEALKNSLRIGGERMMGGEFAGASATEAWFDFKNHYWAPLEGSLQEKLAHLSTSEGYTIREIMRNLDDGQCVETAAFNFRHILANPLNKSVLDSIEPLNAKKLTTIQNKYKKNKSGIGIKANQYPTFPKKWLISTFKKIKIRRPDEFISLLLNLETTLYELFIQNITIIKNEINNNQMILELSMMAISLSILTPLQQKALIDAIAPKTPILPKETIYVLIKNALELKCFDLVLVLYLTLDIPEREELLLSSNLLQSAIESPHFLKSILEGLPFESRLKVIKSPIRSIFSTSLIRHAINNPDSLKIIFEALKPKDSLNLAEEMVNKGIAEYSELTRHPASLNLIISIIKASKNSVLLINTLIQKHLPSALFIPDSLKLFLDLIPPDERFNVLSRDWFDPIIQNIILNPKSLEITLNALPPRHRLALLQTRNKNSEVILHTTKLSKEYFEIILPSLSIEGSVSLLKMVNRKGEALLNRVANNPDCLAVIFKFLPKIEGLRLMHFKDSNEAFLNILRCREEALKVVLDCLPPSDRLKTLLQTDKRGYTYLSMILFDPQCTHMILTLLSETDRIQACTVQNARGKTILQAFATQPNIIKSILPLLPCNDCLVLVKEKDLEGKTLLHLAARNAESLEAILSVYPIDERLAALMEQEEKSNSVLDTIASESKKTYFYNTTTKVITVIFNMMPEKDKLDLFKSFYPNHIVNVLNAIKDIKDSPLLELLTKLYEFNLRMGQQNSTFFNVSPAKEITLRYLLDFSSPKEIAENVLLHLKQQKIEHYQPLLMALLDNKVGADSYLLMLSNLESKWRRSGLLPKDTDTGLDAQTVVAQKRIAH